jgi:outer membrane protein
MTTEMRVTNRTRRAAGAPRFLTLAAAGAALLPMSLLVAAVPAAAEDQAAPYTVETQIQQEIGLAELRVQGDDIHLTLDEAVQLALSRNLNLRTQRYAREQARLGIDQATGIYDFNLLAALSTSKTESPAASNLDGADVQNQKRTSLSVGGSQLFPTGGVVGVSFPNGRFETNSQFSLLNPSFSSGLDLSYTQPLLRGFGRGATEYGIEVAKVSSDLSQQQFVFEVISTIQNVENSYWNLVAARYALTVAEESLKLAEELHSNNKVRVDVGTLAPLELVQSEAQIATRQEAIIRARGTVGDAEDLLFFYLNIDQGDAWSRAIVPDTEAIIEHPAVDLDEAIRTALAARPELLSQQLRIRSAALDQAFLAQDVKPRLDLKATYGLSGLGGDVVIRNPDGTVASTVPGGWDDAFEQVTGFDFPGWSIGVELGIPIQNRSAKARKLIADLAVEASKDTAKQLELRVTTEVRAAVRGLETSREQLESAKVSTRLAEKNLDAERKKYDNGLSTAYQILQVQDDLTAARYRQVAAVTGYRKSLVEYNRATGTLLANSNVSITE